MVAAALLGTGQANAAEIEPPSQCSSFSLCLELACQQLDAYKKSAQTSGVPRSALREQVSQIEDLVLRMQLFTLLPPPCDVDSCESSARAEVLAVKTALEAYMYRLGAASSAICGTEGCSDEVSEILSGLGEVAVATSVAAIPPPCDIVEDALEIAGLCDMIADPPNYIYFWESLLLEHLTGGSATASLHGYLAEPTYLALAGLDRRPGQRRAGALRAVPSR